MLDIVIKEHSDKSDRHLLYQILANQHLIIQKLNSISMTQEELAQGLADVTAQVAKIGVESKTTLQKVSDLEAALAGQDNVSPAVQTAFEALKAQVQVVDDLIPDAPAAPAPEQPAA